MVSSPRQRYLTSSLPANIGLVDDVTARRMSNVSFGRFQTKRFIFDGGGCWSCDPVETTLVFTASFDFKVQAPARLVSSG